MRFPGVVKPTWPNRSLASEMIWYSMVHSPARGSPLAESSRATAPLWMANRRALLKDWKSKESPPLSSIAPRYVQCGQKASHAAAPETSLRV
ncbi:MAG: hypothetical protein JRJ26_05940 [Deltaproteobacteria bacterium]|nr:hypothetical protein [Deltaproteobacteria bacterium]